MGDIRAIGELRDSGLLWLINRTVFHPHGFALALVAGEDGSIAGWQLTGDGTEPVWFAAEIEADLYARAHATLAAARGE